MLSQSKRIWETRCTTYRTCEISMPDCFVDERAVISDTTTEPSRASHVLICDGLTCERRAAPDASVRNRQLPEDAESSMVVTHVQHEIFSVDARHGQPGHQCGSESAGASSDPSISAGVSREAGARVPVGGRSRQSACQRSTRASNEAKFAPKVASAHRRIGALPKLLLKPDHVRCGHGALRR